MPTRVTEFAAELEQGVGRRRVEREQFERCGVSVCVRIKHAVGGALDQLVRQLHQIVTLVTVDPQDRHDHANRERFADRRNEVELAVVDNFVEQFIDDRTCCFFI